MYLTDCLFFLFLEQHKVIDYCEVKMVSRWTEVQVVNNDIILLAAS